MSKLEALQNLVANDLCSFRDPFFEGMELQPSAGSAEGETGMPEVQDFRWRTPSLDFFETWRISGIVGGRNPSRYSESPNLWNPYFQELGVKGVFFAFDVPAEKDLLSFLIRWVRVPGALDLTVTDPYKHEVYRALQTLPLPVTPFDQVEQTQTVNHLILDGKDRRILALNTDGLGMIRALSRRIDLRGKWTLLLGAGGSAASIGAELIHRRCNLWIANRTPARAKALAESIQQSVDTRRGTGGEIVWSGFEQIEEALPRTDVLINTVSNGCPIGASQVARLPAGAVLAETKYGAKAELEELAVGRTYVDGKAMLFGQFVEAAEILHPLLGIPRNTHLRAVRSLEDRG